VRESAKILRCSVANVDRMLRCGELQYKQNKTGWHVRSIKGSMLIRYAEKKNERVWKKVDGLLSKQGKGKVNHMPECTDNELDEMCNEAFEKGKKEGFEEGHTAGYNEALDDAQAELAKLVK